MSHPASPSDALPAGAGRTPQGAHGIPAASHPAPERHGVDTLRLLASLFGAPLAWLGQMSLSEPMAAQACYPHTRPLSMPLLPAVLPSLQTLLALISGAALVVALLCTLLAWSTMRQAHRQSEASAADTVEHGGGRAGFMAALSVMCSLMFLAATIITGLAVLLVSPCSSW